FQNVAKYRIENFAPYALHGDNNGDYDPYTYTPGTYTVSATPYDRRNGKGNKGEKHTITFTVIDSNSGVRVAEASPDMKIYPNPAQTKFNLELEGLSAGELVVSLYNLNGELVKQHSAQTLGGTHTETINLLDLPAGMYIVRVRNGDMIRTEKVVKD
ncbi:MAG: T9SS type A sorting domain-containing protein, partial [Bacteroidetes bacterium]|nr:T9SS type A sorting domain-containing protein [Bacteroidota bacterium]